MHSHIFISISSTEYHEIILGIIAIFLFIRIKTYPKNLEKIKRHVKQMLCLKFDFKHNVFLPELVLTLTSVVWQTH